MIHRRPPPSLKELSFSSWLAALDAGCSSPSLAPVVFLTRALEEGSKLKDATVVRIVQEAIASGVKEINVNEVIFNPALSFQLLEALKAHSLQLRKLVLKLSSRIICEDTNALLSDALKGMKCLEEISLIGSANDDLLHSLSLARPPLTNVDFSYSSITDRGIHALLNISPQTLTKEFIEESAFVNLKFLNIWETNVTTKGCMAILKYCQELVSLTCQWTAEALVLMDLKQSNALRLEQLFISKDEVFGNLLKAVVNLCPCLKLISIRRPKDIILDLTDMLIQMPTLEDVSILQFYPFHSDLIIPVASNLKHLCLSSLIHATINFRVLAKHCPHLSHVMLDGIDPVFESDATPFISSGLKNICTDKETAIFLNLEELKLVSTYVRVKVLDPAVIVPLINDMTRNIQFLHLDYCDNFKDSDFMSILNGESFFHIEDIRLSRASNLTDQVIHEMTKRCPSLRRLVLTMLPKEKMEQVERLKMYLKENNINLELITFTNRSLIEINNQK